MDSRDYPYDKIGLMSTKLVEMIALTVTESPYWTTADIISQTCGQSFRAQGVWNIISTWGRIDEGKACGKTDESDQTEGTRTLLKGNDMWSKFKVYKMG